MTTTPTPTTTATVPPTQPATTCTAFAAPSANVNGSGTLRQYVFHNGSTNVNNTTAQATMPISKTGAVSTTLWNYSTDVSASTAGRYLTAPGVAGTASVADFRYTMPALSKLKGTGTATFFAAPASGSATANPTFSVTLSHLNSAGTTVLAGDTDTTTFTTTSWGCTGFRAFTVELDTDNSGWSIAASDVLQVTVRVTNAVPMILAYDTTAFTSGMILPVTSGVG